MPTSSRRDALHGFNFRVEIEGVATRVEIPRFERRALNPLCLNLVLSTLVP